MTSTKPAEGRRIFPVLWWVYFFFLLLSGLSTLATSVAPKAVVLPAEGRMRVVAAAAACLNLVGVVGLWAYLRRKPLVAAMFWQVVFALTFGQLAFVSYQFVRALGIPGGGHEGVVAVLGLLNVALGLPLVYALWRYGFGSPALWQRPAAGGTSPEEGRE